VACHGIQASDSSGALTVVFDIRTPKQSFLPSKKYLFSNKGLPKMTKKGLKITNKLLTKQKA
jgi:hypothetical protein